MRTVQESKQVSATGKVDTGPESQELDANLYRTASSGSYTGRYKQLYRRRSSLNKATDVLESSTSDESDREGAMHGSHANDTVSLLKQGDMRQARRFYDRVLEYLRGRQRVHRARLALRFRNLFVFRTGHCTHYTSCWDHMRQGMVARFAKGFLLYFFFKLLMKVVQETE